MRGSVNLSRKVELEDGLSKVEKRHTVARVGPRPWAEARIALCGSLTVWSRTYVRVRNAIAIV
jgi:hypothetical protein